MIEMLTILGPTATGKTAFASCLASKLNGEIISADSRQVYRGMDIGTGKDISDYTVNGKTIPHHLVNIVDAGYKYNIYEFQNDFLEAYKKILNNGTLPIMCGGSGMYLESILKGYKLIDVPNNEELRKGLKELSLGELNTMLATIKAPHNRTDCTSKDRVIRAIEIGMYYKDNESVDFSFPKINSLIFGLKFDREVVKNRITFRLKQRLREGLIDEVERLISEGVSSADLMYYGLEYKFVSQFINKEFSYNTMVSKLNTAIHQFSKRQMTWFRRMEKQGFEIKWIDGNLTMEQKIEKALEIISLQK